MVHAVLDRHAAGVTVIDVTHAVPRHDIRSGALTLWRAAPWLAPAVILAVVDPGVGTERRAVAIEVGEAATVLVGPDNGLLLPAAHRLGPITRAVELPPNPNPDAPGETFHGRDVFAPAAGRVAAGEALQSLGDPVDPDTLAGEAVPEPTVSGGEVDAEVLWVDHFGNAQLNATTAHTGPGPLLLRAGGLPGRPGPEAAPEPTGAVAGATTPPAPSLLRVVTSYGAIAPDQVALVVDSYGFLSLSCNRRSAAEAMGLRPGDRIRLSPYDTAHR